MKVTLLMTLLIFPLLLMATETREQYMKVKIKWDNNITTLKSLVKNPMIGDERWNYQKDFEEDYISHITAIDIDNHKKILDISTSSYMKENLIFQFKLTDVNKSKNIKYIFTDNRGHEKVYFINTNKRRSRSFASKKTTLSSKENIINYRQRKSKVFESKEINEAIKELYPDMGKPIKEKIKLSKLDTSFCEENIPIHISSDIDLESLAVFNNQNKHPAIAIFTIRENSIIDFKFSAQMFKTCTDYSIIVVGKDRSGNFYRTSRKGRIACADGCGGGG